MATGNGLTVRAAALLLAAGLFPGGGQASAQEAVRPASRLRPIQPSVAAGYDGSVLLAFIGGAEDGGQERRDIWFCRSDDGGKTFGAPVKALDIGGRATGGCQRGPRAGADAAGRIHVSAVQQIGSWREDQVHPEGDVWLATSADGGKTFAKPVRVNDRTGASPDPKAERSAKEGMHAMAVDACGDVHLVWLDHRKAPALGQMIAYARVTGGGAKPGKNVLAYVPPETVCPCCPPAIAVDGNNYPRIAFRNAIGPSKDIWTALAADGFRAFQPARAISPEKGRVPG